MNVEKDPEELRKIYQELKNKDATDLPSFEELMNRPWKKIKVFIPFYAVAAAVIMIIITGGTIAYFMFHESPPRNSNGPFADEKLNNLYQQQALLSQWVEPTNVLLTSSEYGLGFTSSDTATLFWESPTESLLSSSALKTENE